MGVGTSSLPLIHTNGQFRITNKPSVDSLAVGGSWRSQREHMQCDPLLSLLSKLKRVKRYHHFSVLAHDCEVLWSERCRILRRQMGSKPMVKTGSGRGE